MSLPSDSGAPSSSPLALFSYAADHHAQVLSWTWSHTWLSILPVAIGLVVALPLGYLARRYRWVYPPLVSLTGLLYTIPSLALFVAMPSILHTKILDPINVVVALSVYSVALLVRSVADGLGSVAEDVAAAATAMGFTSVQRLVRVDLPIAAPVIIAGLRVAAVSNVSLVAIAGTIGVPELGQLFTNGFQLSVSGPYYPPIALGIVACVVLALLIDGALVLGGRALTPWRRAVPS